MARVSRFVLVDVVHHVVARGVNRTRIFYNDAEKQKYLTRFAKVAEEEKVLVHGYCLMPNHVHFIVTPTTPSGLARLFHRVHTWWALAFNLAHGRTGHLFQNRYYSSPLSEDHYWLALRYVELNPKRARIVKEPEHFLFSSAHANSTGRASSAISLQPVVTRKQFTPSEWKLFLLEDDLEVATALRRALPGSRPVGNAKWIADQGKTANRHLAWRSRGRPKQPPAARIATP
jgi:putative transposase